MSTHKDYVLGTDPAELARLGFQARLFSDDTIALWKRAGFRTGHTILDVGCGPGFAARDLAALIGPNGKVLAIDESQTYLDYLNSIPREPHMADIETFRGDVQAMNFAPASLDGAYSRWVLCFVANPEAVIARIAHALKPGACVAIQDYANYRALTWGPRRTMNQRVMDAVAKSWEERGGDTTVGLRLPTLMERQGLEVIDLRPLVRAGRPSDAIWEWPTSFFDIYLPKLVAAGSFSQSDLDAYRAEWGSLTADPASVFISPTLVEIVARKRA